MKDSDKGKWPRLVELFRKVLMILPSVEQQDPDEVIKEQ